MNSLTPSGPMRGVLNQSITIQSSGMTINPITDLMNCVDVSEQVMAKEHMIASAIQN